MTLERLAEIHLLAIKVPAPWSAKDFADILDHPGCFMVSSPLLKHTGGAEVRNASPGETPNTAQDLAGLAVGRVTLDEAELLTLAVVPDHQRKGVGRSCLAGFEAEARQRGACTAFLEVAETNRAARALYDAAGWRQTGRRRAYYKSEDARIDAILMSKALVTD